MSSYVGSLLTSSGAVIGAPVVDDGGTEDAEEKAELDVAIALVASGSQE